MDLEKFYQAIRNTLRLTNYLARQEGDAVNVGETFTVRFQLWNDAPAALGPHLPQIVFTNLRLTVRGTAFAMPLQDGKPVEEATFSFSDSQLPGEESTTVDVDFHAVKNMGGLEDLLAREEVAVATLEADLDLAQYFRVRMARTVHEEIAP